MNRHDHISAEHLTAFFDGELPPDEVAEIQRHVTSCAGCLKALADMERTRQAARVLPDPPVSEALWKRIEHALPEEEAWPRKVRIIPLFTRTAWQWAAAAAMVVAIAVGSLIAVNPFGPASESGPATVQHEAASSFAFDYGLYLAALIEPTRMRQFAAKYNRRQVSLQEALAPLGPLADAELLTDMPPGLDVKAVYMLSSAASESIQVTYQHGGSEITVFHQSKGHPVQFAGYEIEPAAVGGKHCLMVNSGRYCAITFSIEQAQYVVIGRRDDPMVVQVIGSIVERST